MRNCHETRFIFFSHSQFVELVLLFRPVLDNGDTEYYSFEQLRTVRTERTMDD